MASNKIQLYSLATPNGQKVSVALEELGLPYDAHTIDIRKQEQFTEDFKKVNPNSKIPAITDPEGPGGKPLSLFESGAILLYLAEKTGKLLPADAAAKWETVSWVMWQMAGVGPMFGQFGHFTVYAPDKLPYPIERYSKEVKRLLGVLEARLKETGGPYIMGQDYTIADIATFPWVNGLSAFYKADDALELSSFKAVKEWLDRCMERPASKVVGPGDEVQQLPESGSIRIGSGLRTQEGHVVSQKCGVVRQTRNGKLWLEGRQKRYIPAEEDLVVGLIKDKRGGENFLVDIGAPFPAQLPMLAFEGATRRNRPNLNAGDLVYARVVTANRDMDPVLSCVDSSGRAAGFGPLKGGLVVECSLPHARTLLAKPPGPVLSALGAKLKFELAVGLNGRLWIHSGDCRTTIRVCRVLVGAQDVAVAEQQQWVVQQLQQ